MEPTAQPPGIAAPALRSAGFTLVELIVTISMAAILMAIGVPMFRQAVGSNRVSSQAFDLVGAINLARSEAIKANQSVTFCRTASDVTTTCAGTSADWTFWLLRTPNGTIVRRGDIPTFNGAIRVTAPGLTADSIVFASDGLARTNNALVSGAGPHLLVCSSHSTTENRRSIALGASSRVSTTRTSGAC